VSAEKRPEDRPDLGPWLTDEGAASWDVIVWSKMDRSFWSTRHCVDFARWAEERVGPAAADGQLAGELVGRQGRAPRSLEQPQPLRLVGRVGVQRHVRAVGQLRNAGVADSLRLR
jgi:hypothetical protein